MCEISLMYSAHGAFDYKVGFGNDLYWIFIALYEI